MTEDGKFDSLLAQLEAIDTKGAGVEDLEVLLNCCNMVVNNDQRSKPASQALLLALELLGSLCLPALPQSVLEPTISCFSSATAFASRDPAKRRRICLAAISGLRNCSISAPLAMATTRCWLVPALDATHAASLSIASCKWSVKVAKTTFSLLSTLQLAVPAEVLRVLMLTKVRLTSGQCQSPLSAALGFLFCASTQAPASISSLRSACELALSVACSAVQLSPSAMADHNPSSGGGWLTDAFARFVCGSSGKNMLGQVRLLRACLCCFEEKRNSTADDKAVSVVSQLLAPVGWKRFLAEYFEQRPLYLQASNSDLAVKAASLLGSGDLQRLIDGGLHNPVPDADCEVTAFVSVHARSLQLPLLNDEDATLIRAQAASSTDADCFRRRPVKFGEQHAPLRWSGVGGVAEAISNGFTVSIRGAARRSRAVSAECYELEKLLGCPVSANVYFTPPSSQGFEVHFDDHAVFVVQLEGSKTWSFGEQPVVPLPFLHFPRFTPTPEQIGKACTVTMKPGDLLYLPAGHAHAAVAGSEASLHLTLGAELLPDHTASALLHLLLRRSVSDGKLVLATECFHIAIEAFTVRMDGPPPAALLSRRLRQTSPVLLCGLHSDCKSKVQCKCHDAVASLVADLVHCDLFSRQTLTAALSNEGQRQLVAGRCGWLKLGERTLERIAAVTTEAFVAVAAILEASARDVELFQTIACEQTNSSALAFRQHQRLNEFLLILNGV